MVTKLKKGTKVGQLGIWDGIQWVAGDPDCNIVKWGGTALTGRDITPDIKQLSDMEDVDKLVVIPKAKGKTTIIKNISAVTNTSVNFYTVTAGTTFYLVSAGCSATQVGTNPGDIFLEVDTGGNGIFRPLVVSTLAGVAGTVNRSSVSPSVAMPISASSVFRVRSNQAGLYGNGEILGWEE